MDKIHALCSGVRFIAVEDIGTFPITELWRKETSMHPSCCEKADSLCLCLHVYYQGLFISFGCKTKISVPWLFPNWKWLFKYVRIRNNFFDTWVLSWVYHSHDHLSLGTAGRRLIVIAWSSGPLSDLKQSFSAVSGPAVYYLKALVPGCSLNLPGVTEEEVI